MDFLKTLRIAVIILWALAVGGAFYYFLGGQQCPAGVRGNCASTASVGDTNNLALPQNNLEKLNIPNF